jgi:hypothetical protein
MGANDCRLTVDQSVLTREDRAAIQGCLLGRDRSFWAQVRRSPHILPSGPIVWDE